MSLVTLKRKTEERYKRANATVNPNINPSRGRNEGAMGSMLFDPNTPRVQQPVVNNIIRKFHNAPAYNYVQTNQFVDHSTRMEQRKSAISYVKVNSTIAAPLAPQPGNARPLCATTKDVSVCSQSDRLLRLRQFQPTSAVTK